jgi:hypothetical protein
MKRSHYPRAALLLGHAGRHHLDLSPDKPGEPVSNLPDELLPPDRLGRFLLAHPHFGVIEAEPDAPIIAVYHVRSATEMLPEWLIHRACRAVRTDRAVLLCGTDVEAVKRFGQRLNELCRRDAPPTTPAPLQQGEKCYHFAPSLIARGHTVYGLGEPVQMPVVETLDFCPYRAVPCWHDKAAIVDMWLVPPEWPVPVPPPVIANARSAVQGGHAYLLCGIGEEMVREAAGRLIASLPGELRPDGAA